MRRYGDSLDKFEPNDLNRALAPSVDWFGKLPPDAVRNALESCRNGNGLPASMDNLFDELISEVEQTRGTLRNARSGQVEVQA